MYQLLDDVNITFKTGGLEIWVEFYDKLKFWTSAPELEGQQDMFEEYTLRKLRVKYLKIVKIDGGISQLLFSCKGT